MLQTFRTSRKSISENYSYISAFPKHSQCESRNLIVRIGTFSWFDVEGDLAATQGLDSAVVVHNLLGRAPLVSHG